MSFDEIGAYVTPPIQNVSGLACIGNLCVSNAGVVQGLSAWYGASLGQGQYIVLQSDGGKCYYRLDCNADGTIDAFATGVGPDVAWPLPDGAMSPMIPIAGRLNATGVATVMNFNFLRARTASGGVATMYLRVYRNILPGRDAGSLKP
jgi:hypothetical protein